MRYLNVLYPKDAFQELYNHSPLHGCESINNKKRFVRKTNDFIRQRFNSTFGGDSAIHKFLKLSYEFRYHQSCHSLLLPLVTLLFFYFIFFIFKATDDELKYFLLFLILMSSSVSGSIAYTVFYLKIVNLHLRYSVMVVLNDLRSDFTGQSLLVFCPSLGNCARD